MCRNARDIWRGRNLNVLRLVRHPSKWRRGEPLGNELSLNSQLRVQLEAYERKMFEVDQEICFEI